jgi:hypothetical protein
MTELALTDLGMDNNPRLTGLLPAFDFKPLTSCCALYNVPFQCPLPPGADSCDSCNYHPVPKPACHDRAIVAPKALGHDAGKLAA